MKKTIKQFRTARGWTQTQMATFCGVSRQTITRIEAGTRISERLVGKIKTILNGSVAVRVGSWEPTWPEGQA